MIERDYETYKYTRNFLVNLLIISVIGIIMVYSASYIYAKEIYGDSSYFLVKQFYSLLIGAALIFIVGKTKMIFWIKYSFYFNAFCCLLLLLTFIPGVGINVKGASRWINLGYSNFQPGEIIKYSLLLNSIYLFEKYKSMDVKNLFKNILFMALSLFLLIQQPDFGTFAICMFVILFVCFMSSFPRKYFYSISISGTVIFIVTMFFKPYRVQRLLSFLDPWKNAKTSGFQIIQSYLAFANGAIFGQGLGNSSEKLFYLPEAHNDFIFSVIGEELGFFGVTLMVCLFTILLYWGFRLAFTLKNRHAVLLVSSIIFVIGIQALLNMGVVLGVLPTKGLNLPFVSYGGSSLVVNLFAIGLIISASKTTQFSEEL